MTQVGTVDNKLSARMQALSYKAADNRQPLMLAGKALVIKTSLPCHASFIQP